MDTNEGKMWEEERKKYDLKYPDEKVVRYLHKNFSDGLGKTVLDFGCGSGRNTLVMAEMNFQIFAVDYSDTCLELTKEKMEAINYKKVAYLRNMKTDIPIESEILDCTIAWGALFLSNAEDRDKLFDELNRTLKRGGLLFADFRTKEDSMYQQGEEIERGTYIVGKKAGSLEGFTFWFSEESEIRDLYQKHGFKIVNIEKEDFYTDNMKRKNSHYQVWAKKIR